MNKNYTLDHVKSKIRRSLILIIVLFFSVHLYANALLQAKSITLNVKNATLAEVLKQIKMDAGCEIFYLNSDIENVKELNFTGSNVAIEEVLKQLLKNTGLNYHFENNTIVVSKTKNNPQSTSQQQAKITINGKVIEAGTKKPIAGATVIVVGTTSGAITDDKGQFSVSAENGKTLEFSYAGMKPTTRKVVPTQTNLVVEMESDLMSVEDVVVTGYQTISKERAAGSYSVITPKDMKGKMQTNIMDRLEGTVAGLSSYKGKPVIRGTSTLFAEKAPLYVVDGVPFEGELTSSNQKATNPLDVINPNDIVNISILKDATAASIYGARSTNGVIVITTKSGSTGKMSLSYSGNVKFTPLPDRDYANLISSEELIDYQMYAFGQAVTPTMKPKNRVYLSPVYQLLFDRRDGNITEADFTKEINRYKSYDRYDQVKEEMLNNSEITHQHNLSFNGGTDFYKYSLSANYTGTSPYDKGRYSDRLGLNLKNNFQVTKWLKMDLSIMTSDVTEDYDNGVSGYSLLNGGDASYFMLRDENGNPERWGRGKNWEEIERLKSNKMHDESYYALQENDKSHREYRSQYLNLNAGLNIKLYNTLNVDFKYQSEKTSTYEKQYYSKDSWRVKNMINEATVINPDGTQTNHIPQGGQVQELNGGKRSHTLRVQINYKESFKKNHDVQFLAGAEQRKVVTTGNGHYRYGYDDYNLAYKNIDEIALRKGIQGTESISKSYTLMTSNPKNTYMDDRYISFYANASYSFMQRVMINGSIRMDQSNLFGTDPKYQYRPLWSVGGSYIILQDQFGWVDRLSARATYGLNGNVYKKSGPYIITKVSGYPNFDTNESYAEIQSPPNSALRWEKTKTTNFGIDFSLFSHRLSGSFDYYNKNTLDLMGDRKADPVFGWSSLMMNYGSMKNSGVEIALNSVNIQKKDFRWTTGVTFGYNKNELTKIEDDETSASSYYSSLQNREGKPMNSLYSIRWAGLNDKGQPMAYNQKGDKVTTNSGLTPEDLVYSGTYDPPYSASMTNALSFKGFDLSFLFVFYGGHVLRDVSAGYYHTGKAPHESVLTNFDREHLNFWKNPGDENDPSKAPAYKTSVYTSTSDLWKAADKHIQKGDYIKLRDITLSYTLPQSIVSKIRATNVRVNFQVENPWRWAANDKNLDPEVWYSTGLTSIGRGSEIPTTYTIGLSIGF